MSVTVQLAYLLTQLVTAPQPNKSGYRQVRGGQSWFQTWTVRFRANPPCLTTLPRWALCQGRSGESGKSRLCPWSWLCSRQLPCLILVGRLTIVRTPHGLVYANSRQLHSRVLVRYIQQAVYAVADTHSTELWSTASRFSSKPPVRGRESSGLCHNCSRSSVGAQKLKRRLRGLRIQREGVLRSTRNWSIRCAQPYMKVKLVGQNDPKGILVSSDIEFLVQLRHAYPKEN